MNKENCVLKLVDEIIIYFVKLSTRLDTLNYTMIKHPIRTKHDVKFYNNKKMS